MIVTNIRYGGLQVQRIYLNDKIIWGQYKHIPIALSGISEFNSYTDSQMYSLILTLMNGTSENTTDADAIGRVLEVDMMCGQGESISDIDSIAHILKVVSMNDSAESKMYIVNNCRVLDADVMKSDAISKFETENTIRTLRLLLMLPDYILVKSNDSSVANVKHTILASVFIEDNSFNQAVAGCLKLLGVYSNSESNFHTNATSHIKDILLMHNDVEQSNSNASGIGRLFEIILLNSDNKSTLYENATLDTIGVYPFNGCDKSQSNALGTCKNLHTLSICDNAKSSSNASSTVNIWYLPIEDGDVLEIRQAYDVIIEDDILEVI